MLPQKLLVRSPILTSDWVSALIAAQAPVYATLPVHKMGQMVAYEAFLSRAAVADFTTYDLDDVDAAFSAVRQLRYQQHVSFSGKSYRHLTEMVNGTHGGVPSLGRRALASLHAHSDCRPTTAAG